MPRRGSSLNAGRRLHLRRGRIDPIDMRRDLHRLKSWPVRLKHADIVFDDKYWNFKLPVSSGTAAMATRRAHVERRLIRALLTAAEVLADRYESLELPYVRTAVLCSPTDWFSSEATVFFDQVYYKSFWYSGAVLDTASGPAARQGVALPSGFDARGVRFVVEDGDVSWTEELWTYGPPP